LQQQPLCSQGEGGGGGSSGGGGGDNWNCGASHIQVTVLGVDI